MTAREVLAALRASGLVRVIAGRLHVHARRSTLTPELLAAVEEHRPELIAALEAEAAARPVVGSHDKVCEHPHVVISNGVLECQRCDMRRQLRPADEADAPPPDDGPVARQELEAETHEQLAADGRDIIAALAARRISARLAEDGRPWASPTELLDEADIALLAAHRDAVIATLRDEAPESPPEPSEISGERSASKGEYLVMLHIDLPGDDPQVVDQIADVLARHPGADEVLLHIVSGDREVTMQVGERFRVTAGQAVKADLDACFGREVARLERIRPVEDASTMPAGGLVPGQEGRPADAGADMPVGRLGPGAAASLIAPDAGDREGAAPDATAAGGLVPGQEGRPADVGADMPAGRLGPGAVLPQDAATHNQTRITAGDQALAVERTMVTSASDWERVKADLLAEPVLGIDTEATGLDPFTARLRLVQLAARDRVYVVDAFRLNALALQPILDEAQRLVGQNLKYDLRLLMAAGLRLPADIGRRVSDTLLAGQLLGAGLDGLRYRLGDLTRRYLGIELDKSEQMSDWSGELTEDQLAYAARDAAALLPLRDHLRAELERAGLNEVAGIEHRALPAMVWLQQTGAPFDQAPWLALADIAEERRRRLERELDAMAPSDSPLLPLVGVPQVSTRWSSPFQVLRLLESRGVLLPDTRDETLHEHRDDDPLIPVLLEHRDAAKRCGAFGREFLRFVHTATGRVHADFFQLGAASGRVSCRAPNLQQIPHAAEYRACFRASYGRVLVGADFGQIEPRCAAEISGEERLIAAYLDRRDVYRQVASELGVDRSVAKTIVLGAIFGLGARGLVRRLKADAGIEMAEDQARSYLDTFFAGYPALDRWRRGRRSDGPVATRSLSGRRRLNVAEYTQKVNTPIQSTAADIFKLAMALLYESRDTVPSAHLALSVHDELVLEVDEADADGARRRLARCMREAGQAYLKRVPVVVEAGVGPTWADTKKTAAPVDEIDEWAA